LEQKRQQIEAREAKKKQTAKAKRARAKERRDGRDEPPPLEEAQFRTSRVMKATPPKEPEPEDDDKYMVDDIEVTEYLYRKKAFLIEDPKGEEDMNLEFYANRRVFDNDEEEIGRLGDDTPLMKALMKLIIKAEFPSEKEYRETMGLDAKAPKKRKPRFKIVAPASARVELREELVEEQPRSPGGEFAKPAEVAVMAVDQAPQQAYMKLMKSPAFTEAEKRLLTRIRETKMTPVMKAKLLARSGLARKLMEMLGLDESVFQSQRARARIADKVEKRVEGEKARENLLPEDIEALFKRQEEGLISYVAEYLTRKTKDLGRQVSSFLEYPETFARCGFGCLGLVAKCMSADPLDTYYGASESKFLIPLYEKRKLTSRLTLQAEVTQAEENHLTLTKCWSSATRENTTMNFGSIGTARFILPELTNTCLARLESIEGIREVSANTRSAGMGYKRRNEWSVSFNDKDSLKRWSASENKELLAKVKTEMVPKVEKMAEDLKEPMLSRARLMKERLEASLTDFQKKAVAEYKK
jgi:hypothetical protein